MISSVASYKMRNNRHICFALSIVFMVFCPILAIPFIFIGIYMGEKKCAYIFVILSGLWAYLTPPYSDLYGWTEVYNIMRKQPAYYTYITAKRGDYLTQTVALLMGRFDVPYPWARFLFTTIGMSLLVSVFYRLCPSDVSMKRRFVIFLIYLGFFNYYQAVIGVRHGFASTLFFYGYVRLFYDKNWTYGLIFMTLSGLTHSFYWGVSAIVLVAYFVPFKIKNSVFISGIILLLIVGTALSAYVFDTSFSEKEVYMSGEWGTDYIKTISTNGIIYLVLQRLGLLPLIYFFMKYRNQPGYISLSICLIIFALAATSATLTLSGRFLDVAYLLLTANMIVNIRLIRAKMLRALLLGSLVCVLSMNYAYRSVYKTNVSEYYRLMFPVAYALEDIYTVNWLSSHIDGKRELK